MIKLTRDELVQVLTGFSDLVELNQSGYKFLGEGDPTLEEWQKGQDEDEALVAKLQVWFAEIPTNIDEFRIVPNYLKSMAK